MKISTGEKLLTSFALHGDEDRFLKDCFDTAETANQFGCDEEIYISIFHFADGSRVEHAANGSYIRCYNPF